MEAVKGTAETGKLDGIGLREKDMEGGGVLRNKKIGILGTKGSGPRAVQNGMRRVLNVALACRRAVRAQALATRHPLPPASLLRQPMGAGAQLRQRTPAAAL